MSIQKPVKKGTFKVAIDTSALISLQLSGLLEKSFKYFSFIAGHKIREELRDLAAKRDTLGLAADNVLRYTENMNIIFVENRKEETGEEEALEIMKEHNCDFMITDDIKFVMKKEKEFENIHFSVFIVHILYELDEISKEEALKAVSKIFEKRRWSENLISLFARKILEIL